MSQAVTARQGYSFYLVNISCLPSSDRFNIIMDLEESVEELLPYLAAGLPACTYVHGAGVINLMDTGHIVAIYPRQITITYVTGHEEAEGLCFKYFRQIEETREKKDTIAPVYDRRPSITVLDIFRALPKTNCGQCHSPTCMAFAARVFRHEDAISSCVPVTSEPERYQDLFHQLSANGYDVP